MENLTGPEKLNLLQKLSLVELLPRAESVEKVQGLWHELLIVNRCLSVWPEQLELMHAIQSKEKVRSFVKAFLDVYPSRHVTPYIHAMMNHVSGFMTLHGSILPFIQQGFEKYNDTMTKKCFRSTTQRGEQCLTQILQKQNRLELLEANAMQR